MSLNIHETLLRCFFISVFFNKARIAPTIILKQRGRNHVTRSTTTCGSTAKIPSERRQHHANTTQFHNRRLFIAVLRTKRDQIAVKSSLSKDDHADRVACVQHTSRRRAFSLIFAPFRRLSLIITRVSSFSLFLLKFRLSSETFRREDRSRHFCSTPKRTVFRYLAEQRVSMSRARSSVRRLNGVVLCR